MPQGLLVLPRMSPACSAVVGVGVLVLLVLFVLLVLLAVLALLALFALVGLGVVMVLV